MGKKKENHCAKCLNSIGESSGVTQITNHRTGKIIYEGAGICGKCSTKVWNKEE